MAAQNNNTEATIFVATNPFELVEGAINIAEGAPVVIGYVTDTDITIGNRTRKSNIAINDATLANFIDKMVGEPKTAFESFRGSAKYASALTSGKTAPLDLDGHIIKVSRNGVLWKSNEALAKMYKEIGEKKEEIRKQFGISLNETYDPSDWRSKYTTKKSGGNQYKGNDYHLGKNGFYEREIVDENDPKAIPDYKVAIRQVRDKESSQPSKWFYVNNNGVGDLDRDFAEWFKDAYSTTKAKAPVTISEEEQAYLTAIANLNDTNTHENTLCLDKVLYMEGTCLVDGVETPFIWVNSLISNEFGYLSKDDAKALVANCTKQLNK